MKTRTGRILVALSSLALCACTPTVPPASPTAHATAPATSSPATPGATPLETSSATTSATSSATPHETAPATPSATSLLNPLPGQKAPSLSKVHRIEVETDAGKLVIEVYPEAAPNAGQRFLELVKVGFFNDTPISRVVKVPQPFVAQFGVNPKMADWKEKNFNDDPSHFALERGTLCFAKAGPNTNSTQVFINLKENNPLADPSMNFTVFGKVVEGMETVDAFKSVGDPGMGLDQEQLWNNPDYLKSLPEKPTMIKSMKEVSS